MNKHPPLDRDSIEKGAVQAGLPWQVICLDNCQSTNQEALTRVGRNPGLLQSGLALFSEWQDAGRGRRGARWFSSPSRDLLLSVAFCPPIPPDRWTRLTHAAALAVCEALRPEFQATIKWPNDIYLAHAKVAGILVESITPAKTGDPPGIAVIGIGLNINSTPDDFPGQLAAPATSLRMNSQPHIKALPRELFAISILSSLYRRILCCVDDFAAIVHELKATSALLGHRITLNLPGGKTQSGVVRGFGREGELLLHADDASPDAPLLSIASADHVRLS
jgi:BirA family biotin operon repressor/biotin-[acetyl-CoA-carboxylase] ligase